MAVIRPKKNTSQSAAIDNAIHFSYHPARDTLTGLKEVMWMDFKEFIAWMETEPESHELVDGVPVRQPDEKQGGRRMGNLFRAAKLLLGQETFIEWMHTPLPEIGGEEPYLYVTESWTHLAAVLHLLRDTEDGKKLLGDTFRDILNRADRLATIERIRKQVPIGR